MFAALALESALAPVLGGWLGDWADRRFASSPWGLVIGLAVGVLAAVRGFVELVRRMEKENGNDRKSDT